MSDYIGRVFAKSCEDMSEIPDAVVQACVCSPPYYSLRDYGVEGQIGLEPTVDEYVERLVRVFREVRRVLRDDGTLWLNLGDAYVGATSETPSNREGSIIAPGTWRSQEDRRGRGERVKALRRSGLKSKDLIGVPWRVARALQEPYYTGTIKKEIDRVWLAAMIDGEGCIFIHKRKAGQSNGQGYVRTNASFGAGLEVANTNEAIVRRCLEITGRGSICDQTGHGRKQKIFRWNLRSNECRYVLREVYPYLVAKQQQARLAIGCPSSGPDAEAAHGALIGLHNGVETGVDFAPPKRAELWEPGWWLRDAIVWSKLNPMPSSVQDRCTSSYEMIFMLAKSARYFADMDAVREPSTPDMVRRAEAGHTRGGKVSGRDASRNDAARLAEMREVTANGANLRNVWTIATTPYSDAHFATFPLELPLRCIRIGTSEAGCCESCGASRVRQTEVERGPDRPGRKQGRDGDSLPHGFEPSCECDAPTVPSVVLDPFMGSGTVAEAAESIGRRWTGYEISEEYLKLITERTRQRGLFC